jgi:hypothetical protein
MGAFFFTNDVHQEITQPIRYFCNDIRDASTFMQILDLKRFSDVRLWHKRKLINWNVTWSLLRHFDVKSHNIRTSFKHSSLTALSLKIMADELPLLHHLQTIRRPDLYDANWKCLACNTDFETWFHLWECPTYKPLFLAILESTKRHLASKISSITQRPDLLTQWDNLRCWSYPSTHSSSSVDISFETCFRGFIPTELFMFV